MSSCGSPASTSPHLLPCSPLYLTPSRTLALAPLSFPSAAAAPSPFFLPLSSLVSELFPEPKQQQQWPKVVGSGAVAVVVFGAGSPREWKLGTTLFTFAEGTEAGGRLHRPPPRTALRRRQVRPSSSGSSSPRPLPPPRRRQPPGEHHPVLLFSFPAPPRARTPHAGAARRSVPVVCKVQY